MFMKKMFVNCSAEKCADYAWLTIRVALAVVLVMHGYQKLNGGMDMFTGMLTKMSFPAPVLMAWIVALLEFFGGIALAVGLCTRDFAALVTIQFAVILLFVKKLGFPASDVDLVIFACALALALVGPGKFSLDAKMKKA
jgi:putative oxidoreductase